ncbi:MAG TPA: hypothetical protein VF169_01145 [Albitalea sp.]|uniref:hypothetical protein n=1 Tax=Piscinibacter sp. TaxID=1903157 RepID=UPI002ED06933
MSVQKTQGPQGVVLGQQPQQRAQDRQVMEGHYAGYTYRAECRGEESAHEHHHHHHSAHGQGRPAPPRRMPLRPRRNTSRRTSTDHENEDMFEQDHGHDNMDDTHRPFDPFRHMQMMGGGMDDRGGQQSGMGSRGGSAAGGGRKLKCKLPPPAARQDDLAQRMLQWGLPGAAELFGAHSSGPVSSMGLVGALVSVVLGAVRRGTGSGSVAPTLTRVMIVAGQAQLRRQAALPPALTLADIKSLLIGCRNEAWGGEPLAANRPESVGDVLALLPVQALNSARPRTPTQRQNALERQSFILKTRGM